MVLIYLTPLSIIVLILLIKKNSKKFDYYIPYFNILKMSDDDVTSSDNELLL